MRKLPYLGVRVATEVAEFNLHLSPPPRSAASKVAAPVQSPPSSCGASKCPWWPYSSSKEFNANAALILVVLICAVICALTFNAAIRYLVHSRRRREGSDNQKAKRGAAAADEAVEIPALTYAEGVKLAGAGAECIICLSDFSIGEIIRVLDKCSHGFHLHCIQKWLMFDN